jgi:PKD repeat protein
MHHKRTPEVLLALTAALVFMVPAGCAPKGDSVTNPRTGPTANFTATPVSGPRPLDVVFTDQSTPGSSGISSYLWSFGDGTTSTLPSPGHLYAVSGTYTVSLTVTTADGTNTNTKNDLIVVSSGTGTVPANAAFSANPTGGAAPLSVTFTDESTAGSSPISARSWTFGDGGTSTATNPSHTYLANGSYTVSLSVTTAVGTDTETKTSFIVVTPAPVAPTAAFSGTPLSGSAPLTVQFTDASSNGSQSITAWSWTFGDGGTSTVRNPTHIYAAAGSYQVSLTVTTTVGSDSETKPGYVTVSLSPVPPTAEFSGTPTAGPAPLVVNFTDQSTAGTSPITARLWTFGDGGASTEANPVHTYTGPPGNFNVSLTVTTADGQDSVNKTGYVQVCAGPVANFAGDQTIGPAPLKVHFTDESTGSVATRLWNFGDGTTSTTKDLDHIYAQPGIYTVSLTVGNACGSNTATKVAYITAVDPCPLPIYTLNSAAWSNKTDTDNDGYMTRARLTWSASVTIACNKSVFAKIYYRAVGDTPWTLGPQSACYLVSGDRASTNFSAFVQNLPMSCYDFRVVLFECGGVVPVATLEPAADADLRNQCFEP